MKAFYTQTTLWTDAIELAIGEQQFDGSKLRLVGVVEPLTLRKVQEGDYIGEPTMRLTADEARGLMDALWGAGVRPSNGEGNLGQLGAVEKHLEDMRRLVFDRFRQRVAQHDVNPKNP